MISTKNLIQTYDEWNIDGFNIKKGEKSKTNNAKGIALFTVDQVSMKEPHQYLKPQECDKEHWLKD